MGDDSTFPLCAAGYFCKSGAWSRYPSGLTYAGSATSLSGPCPVGHYCPEGTEDPIACPEGTFSNQERATDKCAAGTYGGGGTFDGGQNACSGCALSTSGVHCPLASHFEMVCPMGYYQSNQNRGYCNECPAGSFCMNGLSQV